MNLDDKQMNRLEKFLSGEMNELETKDFQNEINASDELQEFVEMYEQLDWIQNDEHWEFQNQGADKVKEVAQQFRESDSVAFAEKIGSFQQGYLESNSPEKNIEKTVGKNIGKNIEKTTEKTGTQKSSWIRYASGLSIAACLAFVVYFTQFMTVGLNEIYSDNSSWDDLPSMTTKSEAATGTLLTESMKVEKLFKENKFEATIDLCSAINKNAQKINPNVLLYQGVSQLELNRYEDALKTFTLLSESNTLDFHKGYWYQSLVYLKQGNKEKAIEALELVRSKKDNFMFEKAGSILKELK